MNILRNVTGCRQTLINTTGIGLKGTAHAPVAWPNFDSCIAFEQDLLNPTLILESKPKPLTRKPLNP